MPVRQPTALLTTENLLPKTAFATRGTSGSPRHTWLTRYRCSLPGLAGFAGPRCTEPEVPRFGSRALRVCNPKLSTPPKPPPISPAAVAQTLLSVLSGSLAVVGPAARPPQEGGVTRDP